MAGLITRTTVPNRFRDVPEDLRYIARIHDHLRGLSPLSLTRTWIVALLVLLGACYADRRQEQPEVSAPVDEIGECRCYAPHSDRCVEFPRIWPRLPAVPLAILPEEWTGRAQLVSRAEQLFVRRCPFTVFGVGRPMALAFHSLQYTGPASREKFAAPTPWHSMHVEKMETTTVFS